MLGQQLAQIGPTGQARASPRRSARSMTFQLSPGASIDRAAVPSGPGAMSRVMRIGPGQDLFDPQGGQIILDPRPTVFEQELSQVLSARQATAAANQVAVDDLPCLTTGLFDPARRNRGPGPPRRVVGVGPGEDTLDGQLGTGFAVLAAEPAPTSTPPAGLGAHFVPQRRSVARLTPRGHPAPGRIPRSATGRSTRGVRPSRPGSVRPSAARRTGKRPDHGAPRSGGAALFRRAGRTSLLARQYRLPTSVRRERPRPRRSSRAGPAAVR